MPHSSTVTVDDEAESWPDNPYTITTREAKVVFEYSGIGFEDQRDLDVFTYWQLLRDAVIYRLDQSKGGREYLQSCWIGEQTEPDRKTLRELFGKSGGQ